MMASLIRISKDALKGKFQRISFTTAWKSQVCYKEEVWLRSCKELDVYGDSVNNYLQWGSTKNCYNSRFCI
jgi:hypothetical protein